jgi:sugar phosphate permease
MSQIAAAPAVGRDRKEVRRWRAFAVLAVAYFMTVADLAIVNVALPTIGRKLHIAESDLQWVVTGYALTFGGFLLLGGRAADLLGRRRILLAGLAVFTTASLGCGLATAEGFLIAMRCVQGLGAAIVLPAALSIVMNMFPEGAERNKALGAWAAHPLRGLGVHLLPQRPDRRGGAGARPSCGAREPARHEAAALRPVRRGHRDRRHFAARIRDLDGPAGRLG